MNLNKIYIKFFDNIYKLINIFKFCSSLLFFMFYSKYVLNFNHKSFYHKYNNFLCNQVFNTNITVKNSVPKLKKPHIIMANHYNATDLTIIKKALGIHLYTIAKSDLVTSENTILPIFNYLQSTFFNALYIIPYIRDNKESGNDVKEKILQKIKEGNHVLIFPEGTSHRDGIPKSFKNGIFYLCYENKIPILPITLKFDKDIGLEREDTFNINDVFNTTVEVFIHDIELNCKTMEELKDKTFNKIISPFKVKNQ